MEKIIKLEKVSGTDSLDLSGLTEIKEDNLTELSNLDINKVKVEFYKDQDTYIIGEEKTNGFVEKFYIKGTDKFESLKQFVEESYNVKIQEQLEQQQTIIKTKQNLGGQKQEVSSNIDLPSQNLETLEKLYQDKDFPKQIILDLIKERLLKASFKEKIKFLERNKEKGLDIFYYGLVEIIKSVKGKNQANEILQVVGKENIQKAVKEYIVINDKFSEDYMYYYNSNKFSVTCKGENVSLETCKSVGAYVWALGGGKKGVDMQSMSYILFASFGKNIGNFANTIETGLRSYEDVKGKLPNLNSSLLKKEGLVGVIRNMFSKTNMSESQKELWSGIAELGAVIGVIWGLFKIIKENGFKGLLFLIGGEFALEAGTGKTSLDLLNNLLYGGFDLGDLTKKGIKKGKESKEYANLIGHPSLVNAFMGDMGALDIKKYCKFENGKLKEFKIEDYARYLPKNDWRKALLEKIGYKKAGTIFVLGLSSIGLKSENDFSEDKKILDFYKKYLKYLEEKKNRVGGNIGNGVGGGSSSLQAQETGSTGNGIDSNGNTTGNIGNGVGGGSSSSQAQETGSTGNGIDSNGNTTGNIGNGVGGGSSSSQAQETGDSVETSTELFKPIVVENHNLSPLKLETRKTYFSGSVEELKGQIDKKLKEKLGKELYEEVNKKLKLLGNLELFMNYMKSYAKQNNNESLGTFSYGLNYLDNKPIFIDGASFSSYKSLFEHILELSIRGEKNKVKVLLKQLEDDKILETLELTDGQILKEYKFLPDIDTPLNESKERRDLLKLLKIGTRFDIEKFFLEKMKEPSYLENDIISQVQIKGLNLANLVDKEINDDLVKEVYSAIHFNFHIFGKKINFDHKGLDKDDVKDILDDAREDTSKLSKEQAQTYIYGLLVKKQLDKGEDAILSKLNGENKKKLEYFYENTGSWENFKRNWKSNVMKGVIIGGAIILTDGLIAGMLPEGAILGMGGLRFASRVAALQNVGGDMSLLLNDQLNLENTKNVATDLHGYMHTAAYMGILEVFGALSKGLSKTEFIGKISGKLETIKGGKFVKNLSLYGFNVAGLLTIDTLIFDGEFTPEEIMNVLVFAALMGKTSIEVKKTPDGKIEIIDKIKKDKMLKYKHKKTGKIYYKALDGKFYSEDGKIVKVKEENLEKVSRYDIGEMKLGSIIKIKRLSSFESYLKRLKKDGDILELGEYKITKNNDGFLIEKQGENPVQVKGSKELIKYIKGNKDLEAKLIEKIKEDRLEKFKQDIDKFNFEKSIGGDFNAIDKEVKIEGKKYVLAKKGDDIYLVEKEVNSGTIIYKTKEAKKLEDVIKDHPEYLEKYFTKNSKFGLFESIKEKRYYKYTILELIETMKQGGITVKKLTIEYPKKRWGDIKKEYSDSWKQLDKSGWKLPSLLVDIPWIGIKNTFGFAKDEILTGLKYILARNPDAKVSDVFKNISLSTSTIFLIETLQQYIQDPSEASWNKMQNALLNGFDEITSNPKDFMYNYLILEHLRALGVIGEVSWELYKSNKEVSSE